ncbi:MAG: hypothetical protein KDA93_17825 [Planctomycetaceae bacterium]|nr:hypothetical protein [Planctomycetaceae bacterium]
MTANLLPQKHVHTAESLIGLGAIVLSLLEESGRSLDNLWTHVKQAEAVKRRIHGTVTLDHVVLAVDFLYAVGAVTLSKEGHLVRCV